MNEFLSERAIQMKQKLDVLLKEHEDKVSCCNVNREKQYPDYIEKMEFPMFLVKIESIYNRDVA